jgi:hypothetical protein
MRATARLEKIGLALSLLLACAVSLMLFMPLSGMPAPRLSGLDKLVHVLMFFLIALPGLSAAPRIWPWFVPLVICYGGVTEMVQPNFGRGREWGDFFANALGVFAAHPAGREIFRRWLKPWHL